jgi:hypothetical protein
MAITNGYCTEVELRDHLQDSGSRLDADLIERAINAASRAVDNYTGRRFWQDPTVQTRKFRPMEDRIAWVTDISTTTGLIVSTGDDGTFPNAWLIDDDFELEPENADLDATAFAWWRILAVGDRRFIPSKFRRTLLVTARFGWSAVPDAINEATILKASQLFQRKNAVFGIAGFGEFGPMRITRKDPDVIELLNGYVRYDMGAV